MPPQQGHYIHIYIYIYTQLPEDARWPGEEDMVGRLERSLCSTGDAALNWSLNYTKVLEDIGFAKGASSPGTFTIPAGECA